MFEGGAPWRVVPSVRLISPRHQTFEGHTNSVLRVDFLSAGMQLVSSASDGLVKLWNIREEACVRTLDGHEDKVG